MVTTHGVEIESLRPTIQELERWIAWVYERKAGERTNVPPITVLVQTKGAKKTQLSAFTAKRWSSREGMDVHEITFTAEALGRDVMDIVETAIHETVHLANSDKGVRDAAKGGRHNKKYRDAAVDFGLDVAGPDKSKGYAFTSMSARLRQDVENTLKPDVGAFRIFRTRDAPKEGRKSTVGFACDCLTVRVAVGKAEDFDAVCQTCGQHFEPAE